MRNTTKQPTSDPVEPDFDAKGLLEATATALKSQLEALTIAEVVDSEHPSSVRELHKLSTAIAAVLGEMRAREKAARRQLLELSPGTLLSWARQQEPDVRAKLIEDISAIDETGSVLG